MTGCLDAMYWEMLGVVHYLEFLVWRTGLAPIKNCLLTTYMNYFTVIALR
jgi:hypothetical protein